MARGQRGGRGRPQQGSRGSGSNLPGRRSAKRKGRGSSGPREDLPTAAPGASDAPASSGSSTFGGSVTVPTAPTVQRPQQQRRRGGPREGVERRHGRRSAVVQDFRYIAADLRWIAMTTTASVALVILFWLGLRA
jgi:hypothetical protein